MYQSLLYRHRHKHGRNLLHIYSSYRTLLQPTHQNSVFAGISSFTCDSRLIPSEYYAQKEDGSFTCTLCNNNQTYYDLPTYYRHFHKVHEGRRYQCPKCGKTFTQRWYLKLHVIQDHPDEQDELLTRLKEVKRVTAP
jgi:hypothetical protein